MPNLATDLARVMEELAERWERIAAEQGVRQFTGNDHLLFANELRATLTAWTTRAASGGGDAVLEWISRNLLGQNRDYAIHVMKRGGTGDAGDAGDLRSFVVSMQGKPHD